MTSLATLASPGGETTAAVLVGEEWFALPAPDVGSLLSGEGWRDVCAQVATSPAKARALDGWRLTNPLPQAGKVICCGLNYADHIRETGRSLPTHPTLFAKFADTLIGADEDIELPPGLQVDWEAELAVVVGAPIRRASREEAAAAIAGYTAANDVSVRDWQRRTPQWFQGKAWDRTTPLGPVVVTPDELDPVAGVDVVCRVNGVEVQRGNTSTLVFGAADLLAYVSTFTRLRPGDVLLTGTPGGVGMAMEPPRFLGDGDVLETEIPGIGILRNVVRIRSPRPAVTEPH